MKEFKGTKGPWVVDIRGGCVAVYQDGKQDETNGCHRDDERNIAYSMKGAAYSIEDRYWKMDEDAVCDYRLIAAAPELLEALQEVLYELSTAREVHDGTIRQADAAIAKALGETK